MTGTQASTAAQQQSRGNLVMSRKKNEIVCIGPDIEVTIVEIRRDKVRLLISAPGSVEVDRKEIRIRKDAERRAANGSAN